MTLADMRESMTHTELVHWIMYHQKRGQDQEREQQKQRRRRK